MPDPILTPSEQQKLKPDAEWIVDVAGFDGSCTCCFQRWVGHESTIKVEVELFDNGDNIVFVCGKRAIVDANRDQLSNLLRSLGVEITSTPSEATREGRD